MKKYIALLMVCALFGCMGKNNLIYTEPGVQKADTGKMVKTTAIGAGIGAVVGTILGGGKGALVGATIGGLGVLNTGLEILHRTQAQREIVRLQGEIEKYKITEPVRIQVVNNYSTQSDVEEILYRFGFEIVEENPDYRLVEVRPDDISREYLSHYVVGYRNYDIVSVSVKLVLLDREGRKHFFSGIGRYGYRQSEWSGYASSSMYQDPRKIATQKAAALAVADFIDKMGFEHM